MLASPWQSWRWGDGWEHNGWSDGWGLAINHQTGSFCWESCGKCSFGSICLGPTNNKRGCSPSLCLSLPFFPPSPFLAFCTQFRRLKPSPSFTCSKQLLCCLDLCFVYLRHQQKNNDQIIKSAEQLFTCHGPAVVPWHGTEQEEDEVKQLLCALSQHFSGHSDGEVSWGLLGGVGGCPGHPLCSSRLSRMLCPILLSIPSQETGGLCSSLQPPWDAEHCSIRTPMGLWRFKHSSWEPSLL